MMTVPPPDLAPREFGILRTFADGKVSVAFPDMPANSPHVPTFRQCFTHTSGLHGHSPWGDGSNALMDTFSTQASTPTSREKI